MQTQKFWDELTLFVRSWEEERNASKRFLKCAAAAPVQHPYTKEEDSCDYFDDILNMLNGRDANLERFVAETLKPGFRDILFQKIDARRLTDAQVYRRAGVDRRLFSKIRTDDAYHPSKQTALALALALELTRTETEELLAAAGYTLSESALQDVIVLFCIEHRVYDRMDVNEALARFGQSVL